MIRVTHFLHKDSRGGGPKVVRQLLSGLDHAKFSQSLIIGGTGPLTEWCDRNRVPTFRVPTTRLLRSWLSLPLITAALKKSRCDTAILHGQWAGPVGAIAARLAGIPKLIYVAHHPSFYHSTSLSKAVRNAVAEMIPCRLADHLVALSPRSRYNYLYREWCPEEKLGLIHNGVDPDDLPAVSDVDHIRTEWKFAPPPARHAVFVGRIDDQKRVDWLLESWNHTLSLMPGDADWHLWIVGSGREFRGIQNLVRLSARPETIHLVGEQIDGHAWLAAGDVVVMSSLYEGHALVPLESMACSRPLASFDTDGVGESVVHDVTGLLCRLGDTTALGNHLAELLGNPERASRMGQNARAHLREKFPIQKTLDAYEKLIGRTVQS